VADVWVWASFGLLLALMGARAWVVETGRAVLGRTPVKVKVLTGACGVALALGVTTVTMNGGLQLVRLLLDPVAAVAAQEAAKEAAESSAPPPPPPPPPPPASAPAAPLSAAPTTAPPATPTTAPPPAPATTAPVQPVPAAPPN
jgi:hypothetical protein